MAQYIDKDIVKAEIEGLKRNTFTNFDEGVNAAAQILLDFLDALEVKEVPIWEKVSPDTGQTTLYKDGSKSYLERFGYRIDLKDLDKLPKKNLK